MTVVRNQSSLGQGVGLSPIITSLVLGLLVIESTE